MTNGIYFVTLAKIKDHRNNFCAHIMNQCLHVRPGETVQFQSLKNKDGFQITFDTESPFVDVSGQQVMVVDETFGPLQVDPTILSRHLFNYSVTVGGSDAEDPQIIVDPDM